MNTLKNASTHSEPEFVANSNPYPELLDDSLRPIGRIGKPHGVKGEVMFYFDDARFDDDDADWLFIEIDSLPVPFMIEEYRFRSDETCLLKLGGVNTEQQARQLTGCRVMYQRADEDDEMTWQELVGYTLINISDDNSQTTVGTIASVDQQTINILFCMDDGRLIPAADEWVQDINREQRTIAMTLPEGLLEI